MDNSRRFKLRNLIIVLLVLVSGFAHGQIPAGILSQGGGAPGLFHFINFNGSELEADNPTSDTWENEINFTFTTLSGGITNSMPFPSYTLMGRTYNFIDQFEGRVQRNGGTATDRLYRGVRGSVVIAIDIPEGAKFKIHFWGYSSASGSILSNIQVVSGGDYLTTIEGNISQATFSLDPYAPGGDWHSSVEFTANAGGSALYTGGNGVNVIAIEYL